MHNKHVLHNSSSSYSSAAICVYFQGQSVYLRFDFLYPWAGHNSETYMSLNKGRKVRGWNQFSNNKAATRLGNSSCITLPDLQPKDKENKAKKKKGKKNSLPLVADHQKIKRLRE